MDSLLQAFLIIITFISIILTFSSFSMSNDSLKRFRKVFVSTLLSYIGIIIAYYLGTSSITPFVIYFIVNATIGYSALERYYEFKEKQIVNDKNE